MKLFANPDGTLRRILWSGTDELAAPEPAAPDLECDTAANGALLRELLTAAERFRLAGGALTKDGQPVAPNPPDPARAERTAAATDLQTQYAAALARLDAIIANGGTFTAAQVRDAVVDLARILRRTLRLLKAEVG